MGSVPNLLKQRWASQELVGDAMHSCLVRIRQGYMNHLYQHQQALDTSPGPFLRFPTIWKGHNGQMWQGQWTPTGSWITLTNIQSVTWTRSFQDQGSSTLTVVIDNIAFIEATGAAGVYHNIERGYYSPTRGINPNRATLWPSNEWADVFNGNYQIELWEGYGTGTDITPVLNTTTNHWSAPSASKTWVGIIEHCDLESHPDHITLTCADFAVMLTDQRVIGQNKASEIKAPITFADRRKVLGERKTFGVPKASSGQIRVDDGLGIIWESARNSGPSNTEWIQLRLPQGFYQDFYVALPYDMETMYVSVYAKAGTTMDNTTTFHSDGWVDLGLGTVPGTGTPYLARHINTVSDPSRRWAYGGYGHTFNLKDNSILRLSFTNLAKDIDQPPDVSLATGHYRAGTNSFFTFRYGTDPAHPLGGVAGSGVPQAKGWILVDDAADVVRMIFLWAGFHEMNIENFGWSLAAPLSYGQDSFFIDIINEILAQGNYCFFIDAPTDHDMSIGVPVFRSQKATKGPEEGTLSVKDTQMSEALTITWDLANLPYILRYAGAQNDKGSVGRIMGDTIKRWRGTYWPPWSGHDYTNLQGRHFKGGYLPGRGAGVRRHFSHTDTSLNSIAECEFACILTAIQYALQAVTGSFQIAGLPGIGLNQQISCIDEGTGTNTRLWVASISSTHTLGASGAWHMTIGGAIVDTEDMALIKQDYYYTYKRYVIQKKSR